MKNLLICLVVLAGIANLAFANEWTQLKGKDISTAISDREVLYTGDKRISQIFYGDGSTVYIEGRPSRGNWKASETQYCSQWPPSDSWACYDFYVSNDNEMVKFVGEGGQIWEATLQPK